MKRVTLKKLNKLNQRIIIEEDLLVTKGNDKLVIVIVIVINCGKCRE